jgi:hypothetical protein
MARELAAGKWGSRSVGFQLFDKGGEAKPKGGDFEI